MSWRELSTLRNAKSLKCKRCNGGAQWEEWIRCCHRRRTSLSISLLQTNGEVRMKKMMKRGKKKERGDQQKSHTIRVSLSLVDDGSFIVFVVYNQTFVPHYVVLHRAVELSIHFTNTPLKLWPGPVFVCSLTYYYIQLLLAILTLNDWLAKYLVVVALPSFGWYRRRIVWAMLMESHHSLCIVTRPKPVRVVSFDYFARYWYAGQSEL